jgi:hypothetical protein
MGACSSLYSVRPLGPEIAADILTSQASELWANKGRAVVLQGKWSQNDLVVVFVTYVRLWPVVALHVAKSRAEVAVVGIADQFDERTIRNVPQRLRLVAAMPVGESSIEPPLERIKGLNAELRDRAISYDEDDSFIDRMGRIKVALMQSSTPNQLDERLASSHMVERVRPLPELRRSSRVHPQRTDRISAFSIVRTSTPATKKHLDAANDGLPQST